MAKPRQRQRPKIRQGCSGHFNAGIQSSAIGLGLRQQRREYCTCLWQKTAETWLYTSNPDTFINSKINLRELVKLENNTSAKSALL
jgi:hypothetical protein